MNQPTTVPKFEQAVAALAGLFTAGPVGALAAWGAIRGLRGKWTPWLVLGFPAALTINVLQVIFLATTIATFTELPELPIDPITQERVYEI